MILIGDPVVELHLFFAFCCCFCLSWSLKLRPGGLWDILAAAKKKLRQHDARSCKRWSMMTSNWLWCPSRFFITNFLCVASRQIAKPQTQRHRPPTTGDNRSVCRQEPRSFFLVVPAAGGGREDTHGDRGTGHWPDFQISRCGRTLGRNGGRVTWRSWSLGMAGHEVHIPFRSQVGRAVGWVRRLSFPNGIGPKKKDILWDLLMSLVDRTNIRRCSMPLMSKSTF